MEVGAIEYHSEQRGLHSPVHHRADIVVVAGESGGDGERVVKEHITGLA